MEYNPVQPHTITVLVVTSIFENILEKESHDASGFERIKVSRHEMGRSRLRRKTDRGTDVGISLKEGHFLRHGDVLAGGGKRILVEQAPEKIITVAMDDAPAETAVLIGHRIGNMHRPVAVSGSTVSFPIQADSELETFRRIFADMEGYVTISQDEAVFVPHAGADVHGHE